MDDLKVQVATSADDLKRSWTGLMSARGLVLPPKCYEWWLKRADLHRTISGTLGIFPARQSAWNALQSVAFPGNHGDVESDFVKYGALEVEFVIARHLALISYVTVTWSIYDRLANACGRLAGISELAENPKQNPKVCEDFLGKNDILGFATQKHIKQAYGWPLKVIYKIRNWVVHEGYEEGGIPLFAAERKGDGFRLNDEAALYLQKSCGYSIDNGRVDACCAQDAERTWLSRDLLAILEIYQGEIDKMFSGLLKWSVDGFVGQVAAFAAGDRSAWTSAAVTKATAP